MEIVRKEAITEEMEIERLWAFYEVNLGVLNEDSPIMQTFPRSEFETMMIRPDVIKYIAFESNTVIGLGVVTTDMSLDPLISAAYFAKHYPGEVVHHFPILCVAAGRRAGIVGIALMKGVTSEVCQNGFGIFFNSERVASRMQAGEAVARLASRVLGANFVGGVLDREVCNIYRRHRIYPNNEG